MTIKLLAGSALGSLVVAAVALFAVWNNRYETSLDSSGEGWSRYWYLLAVGLFLLSVLCAIGAYVRRAGALREYDDRADDERKQASRLEWDKAIADADPGLANLISANRKIL